MYPLFKRRSFWGALVTLLLFSCAPGETEPTSIVGPADPALTIGVTETAELGYPGPTPPAEATATLLPAPTENLTPPVGMESTPFPTRTPLPTPTRIPGPTATPLPLPTPAPDAAGSILYLMHEGEFRAAVYRAPVNSDGFPESPPIRLSENRGIWGMKMYPSSDASRVVFVDQVFGGRLVFYPETGQIEPVFRDDLDPGGIFLGWHPDNRQILIRADDNYREVGLWLVDVDHGTRVVLLIQSPSPNVQAGAISPDGQTVAYTLQKDFTDPGEVWLRNIDGSEPRLLLNSGAYSMAWSPDGSKIAFTDLGLGLYVMNADGSNSRLLSNHFAQGFDFRPIWSPESRTIAFVALADSNVSTDGPTNEDSIAEDSFKDMAVYLVDAESGKEHPLLTDGSTGHYDPTWSPDGSQVAFTSTLSGKSEIWIANVDGTNLRQLTSTEQSVRFPYWNVFSSSR